MFQAHSPPLATGRRTVEQVETPVSGAPSRRERPGPVLLGKDQPLDIFTALAPLDDERVLVAGGGSLVTSARKVQVQAPFLLTEGGFIGWMRQQFDFETESAVDPALLPPWPELAARLETRRPLLLSCTWEGQVRWAAARRRGVSRLEWMGHWTLWPVAATELARLPRGPGAGRPLCLEAEKDFQARTDPRAPEQRLAENDIAGGRFCAGAGRRAAGYGVSGGPGVRGPASATSGHHRRSPGCRRARSGCGCGRSDPD